MRVGRDRFRDRVAIVTGGSAGIGRAVTSALAAEGASVLVCDLVNSGFFDGNDKGATLVGDVAESGFAAAGMTAASDRFGSAVILVDVDASDPSGHLPR